MADLSAFSEVNPVLDTAKYSVCRLLRAGVTEAEQYANELGLMNERINVFQDSDLADKLEVPHIVACELKYNYINRKIRESGCKNVLDIACGYSPRGILLAREGYNYTGIDLPAVIDKAEAAVKKLSEGEELAGSVEFVRADATNYESMDEASRRINGEVCIIADDFFMYLAEDEINCVSKNIRNILMDHGGSFITSDFDTKNIHAGLIGAFFGPIKSMNIIHQEKKQLEDINTTYSDILDEKVAAEFMSEKGLKVDRKPLYNGENLLSFSLTDPKTAKKIGERMAKQTSWVVTIDSDFSGEKTEEKFNVYALNNENEKEETLAEEIKPCDTKMDIQLEGTTLRIFLSGRIDSLVAPRMLEEYRNVSEANRIEKIVVNMKDLVYISSAGLRILLTMRKDKQVKEIVGNFISEDVMEIFKTTGMDTIFDLIR